MTKDAMQMLEAADLLSAENRARLESHPNIAKLTEALQLLEKTEFLTQDNLLDVAVHAKPISLASALISLRAAHLLTPEHRAMICAYPHPKNFSDQMIYLHHNGLLNPRNLEDLRASPDVRALSAAWCNLNKAQLLTPENRAMVIAHHNAGIASLLGQLRAVRILTQENFTLVMTHQHALHLVKCLVMLQKAKILTDEHRRLLIAHANVAELEPILNCFQHPEFITTANFLQLIEQAELTPLSQACSYLAKVRMFTNKNFTLVLEHPKMLDFCAAIEALGKYNLLRPEIFSWLATHDLTLPMVKILILLEQAKMTSIEHHALVLSHPNLVELEYMMQILHKLGMLNPAYFVFVARHGYHTQLYHGMRLLVQNKIATAENFAKFLETAHQPYLIGLINFLAILGLLTQANFSLLTAHPSAAELYSALSLLHKNEILRADNVMLLMRYSRTTLGQLLPCLDALHRARILTQHHFIALSNPRHRFLLTQEARLHIWNRIPLAYLNQANFASLVQASWQPHPLAALQHVRAQILAGFAAPQNTHSGSVHRSVSASATKLMASYGLGQSPLASLAELLTFVDGLDPSAKNLAAKRCILRIKASGDEYIDSSVVSLAQLLALAYVAIHDDSKRLGLVEDAKLLLVEGLYEIQRGNNLNSSGVDDEQADKPICLPGAFNKIIEKLNGIHPDVEIYFITHASASIKFQVVAQDAAFAYLSTMDAPVTAGAYQAIKEILDKLKADESLESIWAAIRPRVQALIWEEFHEAYGDNPENASFKELIDNGIYVQLPRQFSQIEARVQAAIARIPRFAVTHSLWAPSPDESEEPEHKRLKTLD